MVLREDQFDDLGGPHHRGQAAEAIVKAEFLVRGIPVLTPEYDNEPYDFAIDIDGRFYRIQCKTAYRNKSGTVQFETVTTRTRSSGYDREGYQGQADYFSVYNPVLDETYLVAVNEAAKGKMEIRFQESANGQQSGINWHEDYRLDARLSDLST